MSTNSKGHRKWFHMARDNRHSSLFKSLKVEVNPECRPTSIFHLKMCSMCARVAHEHACSFILGNGFAQTSVTPFYSNFPGLIMPILKSTYKA